MRRLYKKKALPFAVIVAHHGIVKSHEGLTPLQMARHKTVLQLEKQLIHLRDNGFQFVSISELTHSLRTATLKDKIATITFDDGLANVLEYAYPILKKYDAKACIYLVSDCVLNNQWQWTDLLEQHALQTNPLTSVQELKRLKLQFRQMPLPERNKRLESMRRETDCSNPLLRPLSRQELNRLDPKIFELGSHSASHPARDQLQTSEVLQREIHHSKRALEELLQRPILHYSYPFGHWNGAMQTTLRESGYISAVTMEARLNTIETDPFCLGRFEDWQ